MLLRHMQRTGHRPIILMGGAARVDDELVRDETGTVGLGNPTAEGAIKLSAGRNRHALVRPAGGGGRKG